MSNPLPLVSIIIPMFERYRLLENIQVNLNQQTYTNFEVIIVDDGSSEKIEPPFFLDAKFKLVRYEKNKGPGYARKYGRELAKGDYICYLDSDDWWSENFLEKCIEAIELSPDIGMVYSNTFIINSGEIANSRVKENIKSPNRILPALVSYKKRYWSTSSCMWRATVSLPENWKALRNNEDYVHDLIASGINNKISFVENTNAFKNQSAEDRIVRDRTEVKKALMSILEIEYLCLKTNINFFLLQRIYEFKIHLTFQEFLKFIKFSRKEYNLLNSKFYKFSFYLFVINYITHNSYYFKRKIKRLKTNDI